LFKRTDKAAEAVADEQDEAREGHGMNEVQLEHSGLIGKTSFRPFDNPEARGYNIDLQM
jgi:hypothetical protein